MFLVRIGGENSIFSRKLDPKLGIFDLSRQEIVDSSFIQSSMSISSSLDQSCLLLDLVYFTDLYHSDEVPALFSLSVASHL